MPSCYPYDDDAKYRVTWTGGATPTATPSNACQWQSGTGECRFDPADELALRFAWPTEGNYALTAALIGDEHQTFNPALPSTALNVAVTGAPASGGGSTGPAGDRGPRDGSAGPSTSTGGRDPRGGGAGPTTSSGGRPGPGTASGSACCDIVPNPAMRGRLGRLVVAYPEEVAARIEVFRAGETQAIAQGYGDQAFDLLPGAYDVSISGKRVAGVTVRSASDTRIKVGVLRVSASDGTRIDLADPESNERVTSGYGAQVFGLPVGEIGVQIAGQTEKVTIEAGGVTEF
jgi:hypothetical protein